MPREFATFRLAPKAWAMPTLGEIELARKYLNQARIDASSGPEWPAVSELPVVSHLAIVGAGTMGLGICLCALAAGLVVRWLDKSPEALSQGMQRLRLSLDQSVASGRIDETTRDERLARLLPTCDFADLADVDAAIEAVFEDVGIKRDVMAKLHASCRPHVLLVSNTSTLDIDALASGCDRPGQVVGMHFLTPAHITPLVEVVRGACTTDTSIAGARALALKLGKLPVLAGNAWGFIGNRMFEGYLREVDALQLEGIAAHRIDQALVKFGFALGPCRTLDIAGTDLVSQVLAGRSTHFNDPPGYRRITRRLAELGRYGYKSGRGHYLYEGRLAIPDPDLAHVCAQEAASLGITPAPDVSDEDIVARCVMPLIEEGRVLLEQGMACRPGDIDLVWVLGYGFPADRGGPMYMASR